MEAPKLTKEQIFEAIQTAQLASFSRPANTYTAVELGELLEMSPESAKKRGELMVKLGIAEPTKVKVVDKRNNLIDVPAFTLKIPI